MDTTYINVTDYQIFGDGTTDNTANLLSLLASAPFRATIWFPYGNYLISAPLVIDQAQLNLLGEGEAFATQITMIADAAYALIIGNTANANNNLIRGLTFKGLNSAGSVGAGIHLRGSQCSLKQVRVLQFGGNGVQVDAVSGNIDDVYFEDVYLTENGMNSTTPGDNLVIASTVQDSEFHRVISAGNSGKNTTRYGVQNSGASCKFVDCHEYYCSSHGFYQNGGSGLQIIGGEHETNGGDNIRLNTTMDFSIHAASCFGAATTKDIVAISSDHGSLMGNQCQSGTSDKNIGLYQSNRISVMGNIAQAAGSAAIEIGNGSTRCTVSGNIVETKAGISISGTNNIITANVLSSGSITEQPGADNNLIFGNELYTAGKTITTCGPNTKVWRNKGWTTESSGTATVAAGTTSVTVTHTLSAAPVRVTLTPTTDTLGTRHWVSAKGATTFTIAISASQASGISFDWQAYATEY